MRAHTNFKPQKHGLCSWLTKPKAWPPDALMAVATKFLESIPDLDMEAACDTFDLMAKMLQIIGT